MADNSSPRGSDTPPAPPAGNRYARWALWVYWPLLFASTHVPHLHVPLQDQFGWMSFAAHFSCYGMLTVLLLRAFIAPRQLRQSLPTVGKILAVVALYGAFDEISQPLFSRDADPRDWLCDVAGALCAVAGVAVMDALFVRRRSAAAALLGAAIACTTAQASAQTPQVGAKSSAKSQGAIRFDYVGYRAARYETEQVHEVENERPNQGGVAYVYFTNVSKRPLDLRFWRLNGKDESHWRLGGSLAWDRTYDKQLEVGETSVLEINGVTPEFAAGQPFKLSWVDSTWFPQGMSNATLAEDPVQISLLRFLPGLGEIEVHVRASGSGAVQLERLELAGAENAGNQVQWSCQKLSGPGHAIGRLKFAQPLTPAQLAIVRLTIQEGDQSRAVYAHRRAFVDRFPIGCWSNTPETLPLLRAHHIDTVVRGGSAADPFFAEHAAQRQMQAMTPVETPPYVEVLQSLTGHEAVSCWMLADEPDWSKPPAVMLMADEIARRYDRTRPTFITLCRNVKFFEYAPIPDIPCMDHYSVTAPSSSKWPKPYGTRLEETAYYTRDLRWASEPKPIWIWTQGIAGWNERPKRPVPTPDEAAAQLLLNLGRGAKGILWFNFDVKVAERYTDLRDAIQVWGRALTLTRDDLLGAEPLDVATIEIAAPEKLDVAALASWDKLIVPLVNLDYDLDPAAYRWRPMADAKFSLKLPPWLQPKSGVWLDPAGPVPAEFQVQGGRVEVAAGPLGACRLLVLSNQTDALEDYQRRNAALIAGESE